MSTAAPMSVDEREKKEEEEFRTGPLSVLTTSVKTNSQVKPPSALPGLVLGLMSSRMLYKKLEPGRDSSPGRAASRICAAGFAQTQR